MPSNDDPLAFFTRPPDGESPAERAAREKREAEERRVSEKIDEELKLERATMKKKAENEVRVLLLGQSESGKRRFTSDFFISYRI